jgi:hypothetical protein
MQKHATAVMAAIVMGALPVSAAMAAERHGTHHTTRHHTYIETDPAIRGDYIMNGDFDWRRRGEPVPWYGHGYSENCVAWTQHAYHYACDVNGRY